MGKNGVPRRMTEAQKQQIRVSTYRHGKKATVVTPEEVIRAKLSKLDPDAAKLIEDYVAALAGDSSVLDRQNAAGLASAEIVRRRAFEQLAADGLTITETLLNSEGQVVGTRKKVHPLLENLKWLHDILGQTAKATGLTRESKQNAALAERINEALSRDQRLREHTRAALAAGLPNAGLPMPEPGLFRETPEELEQWKAECQDRRKNDPVYRARLEAAQALCQESVPEKGRPRGVPPFSAHRG